MSLKLSDLKAVKAERFPDFTLDAEDEAGNTLTLHFRPALVLGEDLRAQLKAAVDKLDESKDDAAALGFIKDVLRIAARDAYHFEVLEAYLAANDDEGDDELAIWTVVLDLYREATQLGEA